MASLFPRGLLLFLGLLTILPAAEPSVAAAPESTAKLSSQVVRQLNTVLPQYAPPAVPLAVEPAAAPDPDVLELPKVTVKQRPRPRLTPQVMMTTKGFNEKLANEKMSALDRNLLNKFTLPGWLGGLSAADRAREEYNRAKTEQLRTDVLGLAKAVEVLDPEQAKVLRDAINRP